MKDSPRPHPARPASDGPATDQAGRAAAPRSSPPSASPAGPPACRSCSSAAKLHPGEQTEAKRILRELVERRARPTATASAGPLAGGRPAARGPAGGSPARPGREALRRRGGIVGTLTRHRDGFGFVARLDRDGEDIFLPPGEATRALDGDLVRVEVVPGRGGRSAGRLLEVVERRRRLLIGTYQPRGRQSFVVPNDAALGGVVPVPESPRWPARATWSRWRWRPAPAR